MATPCPEAAGQGLVWVCLRAQRQSTAYSLRQWRWHKHRATAVTEISGALRRVSAAVCSLYMETNNYHWHISGKTYKIFRRKR
jgi:hypothetical protein